MNGRAILVTRPEPGLGETCARLEALGWPVVAAPALETAPLALRLPPLSTIQAVLLTSRAALPALVAGIQAAGSADAGLGETPTDGTDTGASSMGTGLAAGHRASTAGHHRDSADRQDTVRTSRIAADSVAHTALASLPVFAVGEATAAAARAAGFLQVEAADGDAAALEKLITGRLDPRAGALLLPVGEGYGTELAAALRAGEFRVVRRLAYRARPARALPEPARRAISAGQVSAALFFSPRSAACAMKLWRSAGLAEAVRDIEALAISPRVAATLAGLPWRRVRTAERPDQDSLIDLLGPGPAGDRASLAAGAA